MALNGLEKPELLSALRECQAHSNSWLLLKYAARDEVVLLSKGLGGLSEAKESIAAYPDLSPLYGYITYREKSVLIKYLPEGTSRLLQARTTVHFQDFASAFASSDATLTASSVEDINETTLSKACNLPVPESAKSLETVLEHSEGSAEPLQDPTSEFPPCHEHDGHPSELSHNRLDHDITAAPPDYLGNVDDPDLPQLGNHERRPSTSESVRNILDQWKPRVKQYTRQVAGNKTTKSADSRAALPAGMKLQQPKRSDGDRPRSARSQRSFNSHVTDRVDDADLPPVPRLPRADDQSSLRTKEESTRPTTARQVASPDSEQRERENLALLEAFSATGRIPQSEATSEEKQRLLKALQHRQKNAVTATKTKVVQVSGGAPLSATAMGDIPPSLDRDGSNAALATDLPRAEDPGGKTTVAGSASAGASDTTETAMKGSETDRLRVQKRRNGTEDLRIDVAQGHGAPSNVSDDSLLDELQDAQVQKATPITVQASPMTPNLEGTVSRQASNISINPITIRSANSQNTSPNEQLGRTRTVSQMSKASTDTVSIARLGGVSKGISARIQALAENSSRDPSPNSQSRDLLSVGGLPSRPDSRASVASRAGSRPSSPSRSAAPRMPKQWGSMGKSSTSGNDFSQPPRAQTSYSTFSNRGLYRPFSRAETVVPAPAPAMPKLRSVNGVQRDGAKSPHQTRPGSRDSNVTTMTNMTKKSTESGWRFFSRRRGEKNEGSRSPETTVQSLSSASLERVVEDGVPEEKTSRAGRLLKRMSNMSNGSKKNEAAEKASRASKEKNHIQSATASPTPFTLGDLNVQFPDSLLWKRRWVEIDASGSIVLAAVRGNERPPRGNSRKYHLSEFRMPVIPAHDRQELANSIMLDLETGGGTLQLAFQDAAGQQHFMHKLVESHAGAHRG